MERHLTMLEQTILVLAAALVVVPVAEQITDAQLAPAAVLAVAVDVFFPVLAAQAVLVVSARLVVQGVLPTLWVVTELQARLRLVQGEVEDGALLAVLGILEMKAR
jgi:uncharacterized membrane protein YGL010W